MCVFGEEKEADKYSNGERDVLEHMHQHIHTHKVTCCCTFTSSYTHTHT